METCAQEAPTCSPISYHTSVHELSSVQSCGSALCSWNTPSSSSFHDLHMNCCSSSQNTFSLTLCMGKCFLLVWSPLKQLLSEMSFPATIHKVGFPFLPRLHVSPPSPRLCPSSHSADIHLSLLFEGVFPLILEDQDQGQSCVFTSLFPGQNRGSAHSKGSKILVTEQIKSNTSLPPSPPTTK